MPAKTILVTGAAGFIGSHTAEALLRAGYRVIGLDNFNDYYDPARKRQNVEEIRVSAAQPERFEMIEGDVRDRDLTSALFGERPHAVVHLAAMAGVRASIADPALYFDVNLNGTLCLLECARVLSPAAPAREGVVEYHHLLSLYSVLNILQLPKASDQQPCACQKR